MRFVERLPTLLERLDACWTGKRLPRRFFVESKQEPLDILTASPVIVGKFDGAGLVERIDITPIAPGYWQLSATYQVSLACRHREG